jgi:hypothetical protein
VNRRNVRGAALGLLAVVLAACGTVASSATPSAVGFEESQSAFCSAFGSMLRAVGNPDAGTPSVLSKVLDDAVEAGDLAAAERAAAGMMSELEAGRQEAARAGQWASAQPAADAMDKLLLAFQAMTTAKLAQAGRATGAIDPQLAFEQAGGVDAWTAMLTAARDMPLPDGATPVPCKAYSGTP